MQVHRRKQSLPRRPALGQQRRGEAGQDIATARCGQARIAGGVDEPMAVRGRDHGTAAFEGDMSVEPGCQLQSGGDAVVLDYGNRAIEQTCRFRRVRREQCRRRARADGDVQFAVLRDPVQRIGVKNERDVQAMTSPLLPRPGPHASAERSVASSRSGRRIINSGCAGSSAGAFSSINPA